MDNVVFSIFVIKCLSLLRKTKQKNEIHAMFNRKDNVFVVFICRFP